jgi:hypothetical protein
LLCVFVLFWFFGVLGCGGGGGWVLQEVSTDIYRVSACFVKIGSI